MLLFFYIDDIAIIYDRKHAKKMDEFKAKFFNIYEIRNLGEVKKFLRVKITRERLYY